MNCSVKINVRDDMNQDLTSREIECDEEDGVEDVLIYFVICEREEDDDERWRRRQSHNYP